MEPEPVSPQYSEKDVIDHLISACMFFGILAFCIPSGLLAVFINAGTHVHWFFGTLVPILVGATICVVFVYNYWTYYWDEYKRTGRYEMTSI